MRVIYIYYSDGAGSPSKDQSWRNMESKNRFIPLIEEDGLTYMLMKCKEWGLINELVMVIESGSNPGVSVSASGHKVLVPPHLSAIDQDIKPGDVIFVRGGWRSWFTYLAQLKERGHWMLTYSANTGRQRWPIWDVVFNDLESRTYIDGLGRLQFHYRKPVRPDIFKPDYAAEKKYDLMIGSSHIHDKKGQWKVIKALPIIREKYGFEMKCLLPGAHRRGIKSNEILSDIKKHKLDVEMPGMLPRLELAKRINQSRLCVFAGASGQNDRGPLEAMACGAEVAICHPKYHSPTLWANKRYSNVFCETGDIEKLADQIYDLLKAHAEMYHREKEIHDFFSMVNGIESMKDSLYRLFNTIAAVKTPNLATMRAMYDSC